MKLIGSALSPFVRYTRAVCAELNIAYDYHEVSSMADPTPADLELVSKNNPAMKIPILEDNGQNILDSRIIIQYLLKTYGDNPNPDFDTSVTLEKENQLTVLYAVADSALLRFLVGKTHPETNMDSGYMNKSLERIQSGLTHLNQDETFGKSFGLPELWSIFLLEWFAARNVYDWSGHENLKTLYKQYKNRPSINDTRPNLG